jgi:hypothetical protein
MSYPDKEHDGMSSLNGGCGQAPIAPEKPLKVNVDSFNSFYVDLSTRTMDFPAVVVEQMYFRLQQQRKQEAERKAKEEAERHERECVWT